MVTTDRRPALHWPYRLVAAALAALFLATGAVDAYGLHRCPHHDGLPGADGSAAPAADTHGTHAAAPAHESEQGDHGPCTCIGACGAASAVLPTVAERAPRFEATDAAAPASVPHRISPQLGREYLLPFANAPPASR